MLSVKQLKTHRSDSVHQAALIQWRLLPQETGSAEGFAAAVSMRADQVCESTQVKLLVFPELSGLGLLLSRLIPAPAQPYPSKGNPAFALLPQLLPKLLRHPGIGVKLLTRRGGRALTDKVWEQHLNEWLNPFCEMARTHNVYICPGSTLLPLFQSGPRGQLQLLNSRPANTTCLIAPSGKVLGYRRKINLTKLERNLGLLAGIVERDSLAYQTELGSIGITVCLDGFYSDIVARLDMQGCEYLLQPSANSVDWNAQLTREKHNKVLQSAEWLACGIGAQIQGRENILAAYNPMCVTPGPFFSNSGKSTVWVNRRRVPLDSFSPAGTPDTYPGLVDSAENEYQEEILYAQLPS
ncbi:MAG: nitrilase-related carbon-nitrogen hydrolase [Spirochaetia bacterium]